MNRANRQLDAERNQLAAWLEEWAAADRLGLYAAVPAGKCAAACRAYPAARRSRAIKPGSLRLLAPDTPAARERPIYVAVLAPAGPASWLVAPFGRFATPALPGELALRQHAIPLRVLCLWNAAVLTDARLAASYPAGRLTAAEWNAVAALRGHLAGGTLPASLRGRVGPALHHPLDPRQLYIEKERAIWLESAPAPAVDEAPGLLMAAETRAPYP